MNRRTCRAVLTLVMTVLPVLHADVLHGPKKRITVMDLKDKSGHRTPWWNNVGSGLAEMISAALLKSGTCLVLEREPLNSSPGASLILTGAVTEFGIQHQPLNVGDIGRILTLDGEAGIEKETARCVLDIRFIDTTTGHVIAATQAVGEESSHHMTEDIGTLPSIKLGTERFDETLIGKATRKAVDRAVALIENNLDSVPWYGRIVKAEQGKLLVNTGIDDGRHSGDEFDVVRQGESIFDPNTGDMLGAEKTPVGRIRLVAILGPHLARAESLEGALPQTDDIIQ